MTSCKNVLPSSGQHTPLQPCLATGHAFRADSERPSSRLQALLLCHLSPSLYSPTPTPSKPRSPSHGRKYLHQAGYLPFTTFKGELPLQCVQQQRSSAQAMANALQQARSGCCHLHRLPLTPVKTPRAAQHPTHHSQLLQHRQAAPSAIPAAFGLGGNLYTCTTKQYLTGLQAQTG